MIVWWNRHCVTCSGSEDRPNLKRRAIILSYFLSIHRTHSTRAIDGHLMYSGGSIVGKASTNISPTPPIIFTGGGQKVRNLASFSTSLNFETPAWAYLEGGPRGPRPPQSPKKREVCVAAQRPSASRQQRVYSVASAVDSDCSRTAPGHCYSSTQQLQQCQVSERLPTAGHPGNAARNDVRVWARLFQVAANADVDPFYHDGWSTRGTSPAAMPPRALSYARRRAQCIC